jgi:MFS family permease
MSLGLLGTVIFIYPIGYFSDIFDRRKIIILTSFLAGIIYFICTQEAVISNFYLLCFVLAIAWGIGNSIYTLSISHINDRLSKSQIVAASSTMIFVNAIGAISGPLIISNFMQHLSNQYFFISISIAFACLGCFGLFRIRVKEGIPVEEQLPHVNMPMRSSHIVTRLTKKIILRRDKTKDQKTL